MSRIFKALERAEAEGRRATLPDLQPSGPAESEGRRATLPNLPPSRPAESFMDADLPEPHGEYEQLKIALALASNGSDLKSLMFVSALPGEGVSTVTLGFACTAVKAASQGVLVVDANLGRQNLAGRLGVASKTGIAEILAKEATRAEAIQATPVQRLAFLGAGRRPMDLAQARARESLEELLADLRNTFDYVVLDGGALQRSSESLLLASRVDAVVLVIRAERTGMELVRGATLQLHQAGANVLGTILNRRREYLPGFLARRL